MASLRDMAEDIADYLSEDAAQWPVTPPGGTGPLRIALRGFGSFVPPSLDALTRELAAVLATPHRSPRSRAEAALVRAEDAERADAELVLADVAQDGLPGVAYELRFRGSRDLLPGWFGYPRAS